MGRDKPTILLNGETLVERHLRQLGGVGCERAVAVCNEENEGGIRMRTGAWTVKQRGGDMSAAVRTGLEEICGAESVWVVCVNDIIADTDYRRIAETAAEIVIPTRPLMRAFVGGCLDVQDGRVVRIIEKPPGGCPPGAAANIMVHRWTGAALLRRLYEHLARGIEYESAVNELVAASTHVLAVRADFWIALKTPYDLVSIESAMRRGEVA
jgi:hypothetical protein